MCEILAGIFVIAKKDAMLHYLRAPVLIFGVLFPIFFFLAFSLGRQMPPHRLAPGMISMALFFTASSVGPLVTPWERRTRTYERLISAPLSLSQIVLGDVLAGLVFGAVLSLVPLLIARFLVGVEIVHPLVLLPALIFSATNYASLGVLLASPPTENPSQIMMLSNLVRLPLIFISGVFLPLAEMNVWTQRLSYISPLSYATDLIRYSFGERNYYPLWLDFIALVAFTLLFLLVAVKFHEKAKEKLL